MAAEAARRRGSGAGRVGAARRRGGDASGRAPGLADYFGDLGVAVARCARQGDRRDLDDAVGGAVSGRLPDRHALRRGARSSPCCSWFSCWCGWWRRRPKPRPAVELVPAGGPPALPPGADWEAEIEAAAGRRRGPSGARGLVVVAGAENRRRGRPNVRGPPASWCGAPAARTCCGR